MNDGKFREWLAVTVMLGFVPVGAVVAGATVFWFPHLALWVLLSIVVLGGLGIYFGDWPPIEYAFLLIIMAVLAGLLLPLSQHLPLVLIGAGLPGAFVGYLWGGYCASILDKPNVDRLTHPAMNQRAPAEKEQLSFHDGSEIDKVSSPSRGLPT